MSVKRIWAGLETEHPHSGRLIIPAVSITVTLSQQKSAAILFPYEDACVEKAAYVTRAPLALCFAVSMIANVHAETIAAGTVVTVRTDTDIDTRDTGHGGAFTQV